MHAVLVSVTINDGDAATKYLRGEIVPRVKQAPGSSPATGSGRDRGSGQAHHRLSLRTPLAAAEDIQQDPGGAATLDAVAWERSSRAPEACVAAAHLTSSALDEERKCCFAWKAVARAHGIASWTLCGLSRDAEAESIFQARSSAPSRRDVSPHGKTLSAAAPEVSRPAEGDPAHPLPARALLNDRDAPPSLRHDLRLPAHRAPHRPVDGACLCGLRGYAERCEADGQMGGAWLEQATSSL